MGFQMLMRQLALGVLAATLAAASPVALAQTPVPGPPPDASAAAANVQGPVESLDLDEHTLTVGARLLQVPVNLHGALAKLAIGDLVSVTYLGSDAVIEIELLDDL